MKLFSIRFNKALGILQKNGIFFGVKIGWGYAKNYLKSFFVGSGDILFVTSGVGDKAHYRAFGVAEELGFHGFKCAVTLADNFRLLSLTKKFKIFVLHKITYNEKIAKFIEEIKKQNKEIIFDTDDLDFDPQFLKYMDYFSQISVSEKSEYEKGIGAEILNDPYVKIATTTVSYLAEKLKERGKKVFVVSNKVCNAELEIADEILKNTPSPVVNTRHPLPNTGEEDIVRLGYFSGTHSHNKDFASISEALTEILAENKNVKLLLAGPLDVENKLQKFKDRIEILPRVPREEYYTNVFKCDINLIPLEIDNPFCESRSEIKFIEAGILEIPTVAIKNQTYRETIIDGTDGLLAKTKEEWIEKIEKLIKNENLRTEMGKRVREKVLQNYTNKNSHSEEYYNYLRTKL